MLEESREPRRGRDRRPSPGPEPEGGTPFALHGATVEPGSAARFDVPAALLPTHTTLNLPLIVLNGVAPGPRLWLSAAVHGDELNGVEIIRQVIERIDPRSMRGIVRAVPIVNVFGFVQQSRYLPDRRDLNRSFPGSRTGSLAARIAQLFMDEVVSRSTHGIDLHTASLERANYPQVRLDLDHPEARRMALAFGAPVALHASLRDGSLRAAAGRRGIPVVVYEGGRPQRFDDDAIEAGVDGVLRVLGELGLLAAGHEPPPPARHTLQARRSSWVRARRGGLLRVHVELGERVSRGQVLGTIADPFGLERTNVKASTGGLVIGRVENPVVHGGDAIVHVAEC